MPYYFNTNGLTSENAVSVTFYTVMYMRDFLKGKTNIYLQACSFILSRFLVVLGIGPFSLNDHIFFINFHSP